VWLLGTANKRKEKEGEVMSTNEVTQAVTPQGEGTPPDAGAPKLTLTQYQQLADALSADLDTFATKMPTFDQAPETVKPLLRSNRSVPTTLIGNAIAAVAESATLQSVKQLDVSKAREVMQFIEAFRPIETKLLGIANQLHVAIEAERATVADGVRKIYSIAKSVTSNRPGDPLSKHVANMKRDVTPRKRSTKQKGGTPQVEQKQ
jgi:hypothetical protein